MHIPLLHRPAPPPRRRPAPLHCPAPPRLTPPRLPTQDGAVDWEIARNGALALSIASYELQNHHDMIHDPTCVRMIVDMCLATDPEVRSPLSIPL